MIEVNEATLNSLATKIESLELTETEQAVLNSALDRAAHADDDTSGFVASEDELIAVAGLRDIPIKGVHDAGLQGLSPLSLKLGKGAGLWG